MDARESVRAKRLEGSLQLIRRKLDAVRRRLFLDGLLRALSFDLLVFLGLFCALLFAEKLLSFGVGPLTLLGSCVGVSVAVSILRCALWGRVSAKEAARWTDGRLRLKERVATAVYLEEEARGGTAPAEDFREDWSELICRDGAGRLEGVSIPEHFPVRAPRSALWLAAPAVLAFLIVYFMPGVDIFGYGRERQVQAEAKKKIEEKKEELEKKLSALEREAEKKEIPEFKRILDEMRKRAQAAENSQPRKAPSSPSEAKKRALVELSRRADVLREKLAGKQFEDFRKTLEKFQKAALKDFELSRELRKALKAGDFKKALEELGALRRELSKLGKIPRNELTPEQRKKLEKLSRELARLSRDSKLMSQLSSALSAASSHLNAGNFAGALDSMGLSASELEKLARMSTQLDLLKQALSLVQLGRQDLADLDQLAGEPHRCPNCGKPKGPPNPWQKPGGT